jgi:predicted secreted protein
MGGYSYHFRTGAISTLTENLGSSFPTFFDVHYYEEADKEVKEIRFLPRILTETREGVAAERWLKAYGKSGEDLAASIQTTADKGYVAVGQTTSSGAGGSDAWLLKLRSNGKIQWQKTYGGAGDDGCASVREIQKAGYIVCGHTESFGAGGSDLWILKLGGDGKVVWQKTCGGSGDERGASIQQTRDGGYIAGAASASFVAGSSALWVLKLASNGNAQWQKAYTNSGDSYGCMIRQTLDDGYIVAGDTSYCGAGGSDALVLKLASDGKIQWQKTYGGQADDFGRLLAQATDGGYVVGGDTHSFGAGSPNAWVAYIGKDGKIPGCPAVRASSSKVRGTQATIQNTSVTGKNTSAAPKTSQAKCLAASSTVTEICTESQ